MIRGTTRTSSIRAIPWTIALLLLPAVPTAGQEAAPPPGEGPPPEAIERLERVRMERMQEALELSDQEVASIRSAMKEHREEMRRAMVEQREAMDRLERALRDEPVDQREVARAMEAIERRRERVQALRDRHRNEIGRDLSPEKRARMMLFNQRFERHLRELMARHRRPHMDRPVPGRGPGARGRGPGPR